VSPEECKRILVDWLWAREFKAEKVKNFDRRVPGKPRRAYPVLTGWPGNFTFHRGLRLGFRYAVYAAFFGVSDRVIVGESTGVWNISLINIPLHKAKKCKR